MVRVIVIFMALEWLIVKNRHDFLSFNNGVVRGDVLAVREFHIIVIIVVKQYLLFASLLIIWLNGGCGCGWVIVLLMFVG